MASTASFDISTGADLQEVDNAVNQATKEIQQRYDFKGSKCTLAFDRAKLTLTLVADDDFKMKALFDVLQSKLIKRNVPIKNFKFEDSKLDTASMGTVKRTIAIQEGIPIEAAKEIVKFLKEKKIKKVQGSIQGDQVRVTSPSRDDLQEAIRQLRAQDFGISLTFGNYR